MKVRFQADFSQRIVKAVRGREPAVDFQSANVANLPALSDREVLSLTARDSRVLVSHDLTTVPNHSNPQLALRGQSGANRFE